MSSFNGCPMRVRVEVCGGDLCGSCLLLPTEGVYARLRFECRCWINGSRRSCPNVIVADALFVNDCFTTEQNPAAFQLGADGLPLECRFRP